MLNIINEELMSYSTISTTEKGKNYTKIKVATSNKLQQYENDSRYNRDRNRDTQQETPKKAGPTAKIVSNIDALKPINREIIRISAPLKNIGDFIGKEEHTANEIGFDLPMSINVNAENKYQPRVEVRCHEQGDDRANLYVIAFPFNGMIKPIPENPQYRIYKGLIASSAKPFFFNNRKYRKVLYLVIEINKNLFKPDHKYHTDSIDIQFDSYALFDDRETGEKKTNCESFKLSILSADGDYATNWEYSVADEPIMMAAEPGQQLWVTYNMSEHKHNNTHNNNSDRFKKRYNKQKPVSVEGDMMVTTNKHGIRKEIPMKNNHQRNQRSFNNRNNSKPMSIDQMMQDSGMFEQDYDNRSKRNGGKRGNNNNRGKNRNRF